MIFAWLLAGCGQGAATSTPAAKATAQPFRPAGETQAATPEADVTPTSEATPPPPTPVCMDDLKWITDVTIPDGTEVGAKSTLDKRWEVKNAGNCNWDDHYRLRLKAGPGMNAAQEQLLYPARAGSNAVIRIVFEAPSEPGQYRSAWQAYNAEGQPFGDPIFIDIVVK